MIMKIKRAQKLFRKNKFIDSSYVLSFIHKRISRNLNLFICNYDKSISLAYIAIIAYSIIAGFTLVYFLQLTEIWYLKLINLILMLLVPILLIRTAVQFKTASVLKNMPVVFEEFSNWLAQTEKVNESIKCTSENIRGPIKKPFQVLYYDMIEDPIKAIDKLKRTFFNNHMDSFAEFLKEYILYGGDINKLNEQISFLISEVNADLAFNKKMKERFLKYKFASLMMIVFTFIMKNSISVFLLDAGQNSLDSTQFSFVAMFFAVFFFIISLFEKI